MPEELEQQPKSPIKSRLATSKILTKAGSTAWILLLGLAVILYILHSFGIVSIWQLPLKPVGVFLACGGLACFIAAWILEIWRS